MPEPHFLRLRADASGIPLIGRMRKATPVTPRVSRGFTVRCSRRFHDHTIPTAIFVLPRGLALRWKHPDAPSL
jgi:hypothetical protein